MVHADSNENSYLVKLVPDALGRSLHEDELSRRSELAVRRVVRVFLFFARCTRQQLGLFEALNVVFVHAIGSTSEIFNGAEVELWSLSLRLGAERLREGLAVDSDLGRVLLQTGNLAWSLNQAHRELVALHQVCGRVRSLGFYGRSEACKGVLRDYSRVVEPFPIRLYPSDRRIAALVTGGLGDVSLGVALGLAISQALEDFDLFRIAMSC